VLSLSRRESPAPVTTSDRPVAGDAIPDYTHDYTDASFAAYAAERARQGILVRRGIGQVLGVR
jgi:hypothetical protein